MIAKCYFVLGFRVGRMIEEADKFLGDMKKYREEYKKWSPIIFSICIYAEYQTGKSEAETIYFIPLKESFKVTSPGSQIKRTEFGR